MNANVVINQRGSGAWSLLVNGEDIADSVADCTIRIDSANNPAHVTLGLIDLTAFTGVADVVIDPVLHSVLLSLGWKAPE